MASSYPPQHDPNTYSQYYQQGPPSNESPELAAAKAEIAVLKAENAALKAQLAALQSNAPAAAGSAPPHLPPPNFYAPPHYPGYYGTGYGSYPGYGVPPAPYAAPPPARQPPARSTNPPLANTPLAINAENKRGPKGANLALFCIPNSYDDQQCYDLAKPYGNIVFCSVATHRDTGASRGYAFISYETVEEAEKAISSLHNLSVEGRALRCEIARSDKEASGSKPY